MELSSDFSTSSSKGLPDQWPSEAPGKIDSELELPELCKAFDSIEEDAKYLLGELTRRVSAETPSSFWAGDGGSYSDDSIRIACQTLNARFRADEGPCVDSLSSDLLPHVASEKEEPIARCTHVTSITEDSLARCTHVTSITEDSLFSVPEDDFVTYESHSHSRPTCIGIPDVPVELLAAEHTEDKLEQHPGDSSQPYIPEVIIDDATQEDSHLDKWEAWRQRKAKKREKRVVEAAKVTYGTLVRNHAF